MAYMTFPEFQASRVYVEDLQVVIGFTDDRPPQAGYVYAGESCYIEHTDENSFFLLIERSDWIDKDLAKLERILWSHWYLHEGVGDSEVGSMAVAPTWQQNRDWAKGLTDSQLGAALEELRDRGHATPCYGAGEFNSMFDGCLRDAFDLDAFMEEHRETLEEAMCETAREYFRREASDAFVEEEEEEAIDPHDADPYGMHEERRRHP